MGFSVYREEMMMKKIVLSLLSLSLGFVLLLALVACSGGNDYDGTYRLEGAVGRAMVFTLEDGTWSFSDGEYDMTGTYTVSDDGRIVMTHVMDENQKQDRGLIATYDLENGQSVEMFRGSIGDGKLTLEEYMEKPMLEKMTYERDDESK